MGREPHSVLSIYTHARTQHAARTHARTGTHVQNLARARNVLVQAISPQCLHVPARLCFSAAARKSERAKIEIYPALPSLVFSPVFTISSGHSWSLRSPCRHGTHMLACWVVRWERGNACEGCDDTESRALTPLECPPSAPPLRAVLRRSEMFRQTPCSARHRVPAQQEAAAFAWFQKASGKPLANSSESQELRQDSRRELTKKTLRRWTRGAERGPAAPQERECCTARMWRQSYTSWYQD